MHEVHLWEDPLWPSRIIEGPRDPLLLSDEMKELDPRPRRKVGSHPCVCRCIYYAIIDKRRKEISKSGKTLCRRQQLRI